MVVDYLEFRLPPGDFRILSLCTGESGNNTISKQMHYMHGGQLSAQDREGYPKVLQRNVMEALQGIIKMMFAPEHKAVFGPYCNEVAGHKELMDEVMALDPEEYSSTGLAAKIALLWAHPAVKAVARRATRRGQLSSQYEYYLDNAVRFEKLDTVSLTTADILRVRIRTSGIVEERFSVPNGVNFIWVRAGGQRNERKKWVHCFDGVNLVVYIFPLGDYDHVLYEDSTANRVQESIDLWGGLVNNKSCENCSFLLLLNQADRLRYKITSPLHEPVSHFFPDYTGKRDDFDAIIAYFSRRLLSLPNRTVDIRVEVTTAIDEVTQDVLRSSLLHFGSKLLSFR